MTQAAVSRSKNCSRESGNPSRKIAVFIFATVFLVALLSVSITAKGSGENAVYPEGVSEGRNQSAVVKVSAGSIEDSLFYTDKDVEMISKTVYGEALVTDSDTHMSYVVWCILNRVDSEGYGCGESIEHVITFPGQFVGYDENNPVEPHIEWLVRDVLNRWVGEKQGQVDVCRTLPRDYLWFNGDGKYNHFRNAYDINEAEYWPGAVVTPYKN